MTREEMIKIASANWNGGPVVFIDTLIAIGAVKIEENSEDFTEKFINILGNNFDGESCRYISFVLKGEKLKVVKRRD